MSNNNLDLDEIKKLLEHIYISDLGKNIAQLLSGLSVKMGVLHLIIELPEEVVLDQQGLIDQINQLVVNKTKIIKDIRVVFTNKKYITKQANQKTLQRIPNVKKIILLASAKGGVGKSTTAANLALALSCSGTKVGIVDADIYGPTIPKLLGINQKPITQDGKMLPLESQGIYSISVGYLINEGQAAIWRGPMISKALYQLLVGVKWPELDYLIIDMPPGTGDIYLSLAENFIVDGVILLSTPQNIALSMVKKSIAFFIKTNIPIVGIVENMSYFLDENNITHYLFGRSTLEELDVDIIAQIPLIPKISEFSDQGLSLVKEKEFLNYTKIAEKLKQWRSA
jgi:ATP-binding protein involved in chromosome partitioning